MDSNDNSSNLSTINIKMAFIFICLIVFIRRVQWMCNAPSVYSCTQATLFSLLSDLNSTDWLPAAIEKAIRPDQRARINQGWVKSIPRWYSLLQWWTFVPVGWYRQAVPRSSNREDRGAVSKGGQFDKSRLNQLNTGMMCSRWRIKSRLRMRMILIYILHINNK